MAGQPEAPDIIDGPERVEVTAIGAIHRSAMETQIARADAKPRSIKKFLDDATSMVTADEDTAAACIFSLPRAGKPIEGATIRMAEIVALAWGNLNCLSRVTEVGRTTITGVGIVYDCENNVAISREVQRRITTKNGGRFGDDMIVVTGNAAAAIAYRNAIFSIVPKVFINRLYQAARETAIGSAETLAGRRASLVEYFGKMSVEPEDVARVVGHTLVEEITLDDLGVLRGLATAIKEGMISLDEAFAKESGDDNGKPARGVAGLRDQLKNSKPKAQQSAAPAPAPVSQAATEPDEAADTGKPPPKAKRGRPRKDAAPVPLPSPTPAEVPVPPSPYAKIAPKDKSADELTALRKKAFNLFANIEDATAKAAALKNLSLPRIEAIGDLYDTRQMQSICDAFKSEQPQRKPQPAPA